MKRISIFIGLTLAATLLPSQAMATESSDKRIVNASYVQAEKVEAKSAAQSRDLSSDTVMPIRRIVRKVVVREDSTVFATVREGVIYSDKTSNDAMTVYRPRDKASKMPNHFKN